MLTVVCSAYKANSYEFLMANLEALNYASYALFLASYHVKLVSPVHWALPFSLSVWQEISSRFQDARFMKLWAGQGVGFFSSTVLARVHLQVFRKPWISKRCYFGLATSRGVYYCVLVRAALRVIMMASIFSLLVWIIWCAGLHQRWEFCRILNKRSGNVSEIKPFVLIESKWARFALC